MNLPTTISKQPNFITLNVPLCCPFWSVSPPGPCSGLPLFSGPVYTVTFSRLLYKQSFSMEFEVLFLTLRKMHLRFLTEGFQWIRSRDALNQQ